MNSTGDKVLCSSSKHNSSWLKQDFLTEQTAEIETHVQTSFPISITFYCTCCLDIKGKLQIECVTNNHS